MALMKKTNKPGPPAHISNPKGQKLPYDKLRVLIMDTIQRNKSQTWTARQLIKKLKIANGKSDAERVLESLVKQGKLSVGDGGIYSSMMTPKVSGEKIRPSKAR